MAGIRTQAVVKVGVEDKDNILTKKANLVTQWWIGGVREGFTVWKDRDWVNSLMCGPVNALKPPSHETCNYQGSANQEWNRGEAVG